MISTAREYFIVVGEDGGGYGRPPTMGETLRQFLAKDILTGYWGRGRDPATAKEGKQGIIGWEDQVVLIEALWWEDEPAVWARVLVPSDSKVIDFGGPALSNRYHAPCIHLEVES